MEKDRKPADTRADELDRFWDVEALLPARRIPPRPSRNTEPEEIVIPPRPDRADGARDCPLPRAEKGQTVIHTPGAPLTPDSVRHRIAPQTEPAQPTPDSEYEPQSALIRRVRIYSTNRSALSYYQKFVQTALRLSGKHGSPCAPVPFFSYVPQYDQMTKPQLAWYLYLRDCIRNGEYPDTDESYLVLLIYEIINLGSEADPAAGQTILCRIWEHYRQRYQRLSSSLPDWICDYSLIHRLPPPALSDGELTDIMTHCELKEFYLPGNQDDRYLNTLLTFCSNYDYRKSKFCTAETGPLFDRVIRSILKTVTELLSREGKLFSSAGMEDSRLIRNAYAGALCAYRNKRKIEIDYCSFSRSHELRFLLTDVVKYTENKLRSHLGIRSRMTVYALPVPIRTVIDVATAELLPKKEASAPRQREPEAYEKLYDLPPAPLDLTHASQIERASWETTQRLVEAFDENPPDETPHTVQAPPVSPTPLPVPEAPATPEAPAVSESPWKKYRTFLVAVRDGDRAAIRSSAAALGGLPDAVADEINELAAEELGDVLLEESDIWHVIDTYRPQLEAILSGTEKGDPHGTERNL